MQVQIVGHGGGGACAAAVIGDRPALDVLPASTVVFPPIVAAPAYLSGVEIDLARRTTWTPVSTSSATKPPGLMRLMPYAPDEPPKLLRCPHRSRIDRERFARQPERRLLQYHSLGSLVPGANSAVLAALRVRQIVTPVQGHAGSPHGAICARSSPRTASGSRRARRRRSCSAYYAGGAPSQPAYRRHGARASRSCKRKAGSLSAQHRRRSEAVAVWA